MFRTFFLLIAVIALFFIIRSFVVRGLQRRPAKQRLITHDMVQCEFCQSYLPKNIAITERGKTFCSQRHFKKWDEKV